MTREKKLQSKCGQVVVALVLRTELNPDGFSKYMFFFSSSNLFTIFQEDLSVCRYLFVEQTCFFQEGLYNVLQTDTNFPRGFIKLTDMFFQGGDGDCFCAAKRNTKSYQYQRTISHDIPTRHQVEYNML